MTLQEACETMEEFTDKEAVRVRGKLSIKEFLALQKMLLELQTSGKYKLPEKYKVKS